MIHSTEERERARDEDSLEKIRGKKNGEQRSQVLLLRTQGRRRESYRMIQLNEIRQADHGNQGGEAARDEDSENYKINRKR